MAFQHVDTVVIGGGQAGLAVSWGLTQHSHDHVVLERGQVANRWRESGWDSLRLLTPNWMSRLPGWSYRGDDPDGYLPASGLIDYLAAYAHSFTAPVVTGTVVSSVSQCGDRYRIDTDGGRWSARSVVVATGACGSPYVPDLSTGFPADVYQLTPSGYRNPAALPTGGALVIGASASGVQIAQELRRSGRRVVLSVGRHNRVPRGYRGMDIWWWLEQLGRLDRTAEGVADIVRVRQEPSLQLVGRPGEDLDLGILAREGVTIAGRLVGVAGHRVEFADDLALSTGAADARLRRLLDAIDSHVGAHGLQSEVLEPTTLRRFELPRGLRNLDLTSGISTVIWATGYRPHYQWLHVPVLDAAGQVREHGGRTSAPGLYGVGLPFGQRRSSSLLDGVGRDAAAVVADLVRDRCGNGAGQPVLP